MTALTHIQLPLPQRRHLIVTGLAGAILFAGLSLPADLSTEGRASLIAVALAMLGWIGTRLPESLVALGAVLGLVLTGVLSEQTLFDALGSELIWLLLSAFVIAAVLKDARLTERMIAPLLRRPMRFDLFVILLTFAIAATAFVLPSTSGRAALLMPIFVALVAALPDPRMVKPLALLFPTVILLSAGASLIGAGAHLLATESIRAATGLRIGYLDWAMLGLPFALVTSLVGALLILWLFVPAGLRHARIAVPDMGAIPDDLRKRQRRISVVILAVVLLWLTADLHGLGIALTALLGAMILLTKPFTPRKTKEMFRAVDVELLLYMAATVLLAQAMTQTGADRWLAHRALGVLPPALSQGLPTVAILMSVVAVAAHLFVTSRSARAAVLIPAVALPLAGFGHDAALLILIAVMGTGFCQTMMASAKPVAIFANAETETFTQKDLFRLALPLMPIVTVVLVGFALMVWPAQLQSLRGEAPSSAPAVTAAKPLAVPALPVPARLTGLTVSDRPAPRPVKRVTAAQKPSAKRHSAPAPLRQMERDLNRAFRAVGLRVRFN